MSDRPLHESRVEGHGLGPAETYGVEVEAGPRGVAVIALEGELDIAATEEVRAAVDGAAAATGVVIDVARVTFVDSSMLKELLRAGAELSRYDTRLVLADVGPPVARLLELTRTAGLFTIAEDRAAALRMLEQVP